LLLGQRKFCNAVDPERGVGIVLVKGREGAKNSNIVCIRSTASLVSPYEWSDGPVSIELLILEIHSHNRKTEAGHDEAEHVKSSLA
jgi:hypothetical protein